MDQKRQRRKLEKQRSGGSKYDLAFKLKIARHYHEGTSTIEAIARQFGIRHQNVSRWGLEFSSELAAEPILPVMTEQESKRVEALEQQLAALKKKLEYEEMKTFALETMIDLAKTELGIDLRKNSGAKQPKK
jgi:transposase